MGLRRRTGASFALSRAVRAVLVGADPPVRFTRRAVGALATARERHQEHVWSAGSVISRAAGDVRWWTWAGTRANLTLRATLAGLVAPGQQVHDSYLRLREDVDPAAWAAARDGATDRIALPDVSEKALEGLKFTAALPPHLAARTLAARLADVEGARTLLGEPTRFVAG